jgi:catechol 2,3-dioxygenase-like lactoylglutathione lyase family enzyme
MSVQLNHTIVHARNKRESANFLSEILGLRAPKPFYSFLVVNTENGVSLDFLETNEDIQIQHYAFLVSEEEFDAIFARIKQRSLKFWSDPMRRNEGVINQNDGGRGCYFQDPSGHILEIITRPYGSGQH